MALRKKMLMEKDTGLLKTGTVHYQIFKLKIVQCLHNVNVKCVFLFILAGVNNGVMGDM